MVCQGFAWGNDKGGKKEKEDKNKKRIRKEAERKNNKKVK